MESIRMESPETDPENEQLEQLTQLTAAHLLDAGSRELGAEERKKSLAAFKANLGLVEKILDSELNG